MEDIQKILSANLTYLVKKKYRFDYPFTNKAGIRGRIFTDIKSGKHWPNIGTIVAMADALGVEPSELFIYNERDMKAWMGK